MLRSPKLGWRPSMLAWLLSLTAHATATVGAAHCAGPRRDSVGMGQSGRLTLDVELAPPVSGVPGHPAHGAAARAETQPVAGGERLARPDTRRAGRGGEPFATAAAANLAERDDGALRAPELQSRLERSQLARHGAGAAARTSPEDQRVTPRPTELTFVAIGVGSRQESRPWSATDPSVGSMRGARASAGLHPGSEARRERGDLEPDPRTGGDEPAPPTPAAAPGVGVPHRPPGHDERQAARVATAEPAALRGAVSTPAVARGEQRDTDTSRQEVATRHESLMPTSGAGGLPGRGVGGEPGGGQPGAGGLAGPGFVARPLGDGRGAGLFVDPFDARRRGYLRAVRARIHGSWSEADFPRAAALSGRAGYAIVSFTILADGSVSGAMVARPSGFPSFDDKMRRAVLRAAPFGPLPEELRPALSYSYEFVVENPSVAPP